MQLKVSDIVRLFGVSQRTVYGWVRNRGLPGIEVGGQFRFNRAEVLEWATAQNVAIPEELIAGGAEESAGLPGLAAAVAAGGIHYGIAGRTKSEVLRGIVDRMPLPETVDRNFLYRVLLAREALGSTAIGEGIAIPHPRNPIIVHAPRPAVSLCFLEQRIDFEALDARPVHVLFSMISTTVRIHLHLLSRISFALQDPEFKAAVIQHCAADELHAHLRRIEGGLPYAAPSPRV